MTIVVLLFHHYIHITLLLAPKFQQLQYISHIKLRPVWPQNPVLKVVVVMAGAKTGAIQKPSPEMQIYSPYTKCLCLTRPKPTSSGFIFLNTRQLWKNLHGIKTFSNNSISHSTSMSQLHCVHQKVQAYADTVSEMIQYVKDSLCNCLGVYFNSCCVS